MIVFRDEPLFDLIRYMSARSQDPTRGPICSGEIELRPNEDCARVVATDGQIMVWAFARFSTRLLSTLGGPVIPSPLLWRDLDTYVRWPNSRIPCWRKRDLFHSLEVSIGPEWSELKSKLGMAKYEHFKDLPYPNHANVIPNPPFVLRQQSLSNEKLNAAYRILGLDHQWISTGQFLVEEKGSLDPEKGEVKPSFLVRDNLMLMVMPSIPVTNELDRRVAQIDPWRERWSGEKKS